MKKKEQRNDSAETELVPVTDATVADWALEPSGSPEEFGFRYDSATREKRHVWDRQEVFLAGIRESGRVFQAAALTGVTRWAHDKWMQGDVFGYRERYNGAHADWCGDKIEGMIDDRLADPQGNRGSDILLIAKARAEMPGKYREQVTVVDTSAIRESLDALRQLGTPRVVEGSSHVVSEEPDKTA